MIKKFICMVVDSHFNKLMEDKNNEINILAEFTKVNQKQLEQLDFLLKMYRGKLNKERERHVATMNKLKESVEMEKFYCYIIPRLINAAGLENEINIDLSNYDDVLELYDRLKDGDLKNI